MKSSGELKSRGVKLLPGKDNSNKLSLSKSFICLMQMFHCLGFFCFLLHHLVRALSYSTRFDRSLVLCLSNTLTSPLVLGFSALSAETYSIYTVHCHWIIISILPASEPFSLSEWPKQYKWLSFNLSSYVWARSVKQEWPLILEMICVLLRWN